MSAVSFIYLVFSWPKYLKFPLSVAFKSLLSLLLPKCCFLGSQRHLHSWLHPVIIFPLDYNACFTPTQLFLRIARHWLVRRCTHPNTLRYCHQLSHTLPSVFNFFFSPLICLLFDTWYEPLKLLFGTVPDPPTGSALRYNTATTSTPIFTLPFFRIQWPFSSCTSASAWLPLPLCYQQWSQSFQFSSPCSLLPGSSLCFLHPSPISWHPDPAFGPLPEPNPPSPPAPTQPGLVWLNHGTQSRLASRFSGLAHECVYVSLPSPKHRWTWREHCQILLV